MKNHYFQNSPNFKKHLLMLFLSASFILYSLSSVAQTGTWNNGTETRTNSNLGIGTFNPDGKTEIFYNIPTINGLVVTRINSASTNPGNGGVEGAVTNPEVATNTDLSGITNSVFQYPDLRLQLFNNNDKPLMLGRTFEVPANIFKNKLILTSSGNLSLNNESPRSALDVVSRRLTYNSPTAVFGIKPTAGSNYTRHIQFVNKLSDKGYSNLSETGDQGIFWTDGTGSCTQSAGTVTQTVEGTNQASGLVIAPWNHGNDGLKITFDGNVGIGIQKPKGKLDVNGKIYCKSFELTNPGGLTIMKISSTGYVWAQEVKVRTTDPYPDFVFAKDFKLMSLKELESFLNQNKHLPGIPTEKEVTDNGMELGKMNVLLLQKIEEMTLYMIMLNNEIEKLKTQQNHN